MRLISCRAALEEGVLPGGGVWPIRVTKALDALTKKVGLGSASLFSLHSRDTSYTLGRSCGVKEWNRIGAHLPTSDRCAG